MLLYIFVISGAKFSGPIFHWTIFRGANFPVTNGTGRTAVVRCVSSTVPLNTYSWFSFFFFFFSQRDEHDEWSTLASLVCGFAALCLSSFVGFTEAAEFGCSRTLEKIIGERFIESREDVVRTTLDRYNCSGMRARQLARSIVDRAAGTRSVDEKTSNEIDLTRCMVARTRSKKKLRI